ncbi:hypothetical protein, partial [Azospirillum sp. B4]|uniref:hypothetical protein n=1 Tax=Azospirillum sp. B4 TaxID=95605 RepID=UPI0011DDAF3B
MTRPELNGDVFDAYMTTYGELAPEFLKQYVRDHRKRFLATLRALPPADGPGARGLEIGTYGLFPVAMRQMLGYADADGVVYETKGDVPLVDYRRYPFDGEEYAY